MATSKQRTIPAFENGRMNLSADIRRALGLSGSGHLLVSLVEDEIRITTTSRALRRVRELASPYKPTNGRACDQLIEERREAAAREDNELGGSDLGGRGTRRVGNSRRDL